MLSPCAEVEYGGDAVGVRERFDDLPGTATNCRQYSKKWNAGLCTAPLSTIGSGFSSRLLNQYAIVNKRKMTPVI